MANTMEIRFKGEKLIVDLDEAKAQEDWMENARKQAGLISIEELIDGLQYVEYLTPEEVLERYEGMITKEELEEYLQVAKSNG